MRTLTISLLVVALLATIGLGWMFDHLYGQYATENAHNKDNSKIVEQIGTELALTLDQQANTQAFVDKWREDAAFTIEVTTFDDFPLPKALVKSIMAGEPVLLESSQHLAFHYYLPNHKELLILKSPLLDVKQTNMGYLFTILFYLGLVVIFLAWVYPLIRQLLSLRKVAKAFGDGQLQQRVKIGPISYIRDIEIEFNQMAQRIEGLVNDVKLLSSAVSHDLRTPLARIRFGVDTLQEEEDPIARKRFEQKISDNVDEMTSLVETLLKYARLDQAMIELKKEPVDLNAIILNSIKNKKIDGKKITFNKPNFNNQVIGDAAYLSMLINNLIQNALQYGHKEICIELAQNMGGITLSISDDGDGIIEAERENMFKPFVRGDHTRQKRKGHGIGLAIVKRIVDWHQAKIEINQAKNLGGAEFLVTFTKTKTEK